MSISAWRVKQRRGVQPLVINPNNQFKLLLLFAILVCVAKDAIFDTIQAVCFYFLRTGEGGFGSITL